MSRHDAVLAESGVGYRQHRIPALVRTAAGTLLAAYDGRPDLDDLPAPIDLVLRRSTDDGESWAPPTTIRSARGLTGYGDPSLLADARTGRVWCFHAAGDGVGFFESAAGERDDDPAIQHCDVSVSDDDGLTWAHRRLTAPLRRGLAERLAATRPGAQVRGLFAASGAGVQILHGPWAGRLLQGYVALVRAADGATTIEAAVARSDDAGETWQVSDLVGPTANENALAVLPDGRVLLHSRAPGRRSAAWSADGGVTFGPLEPVADLRDPGNNGSLTACRDMLVATHTADPDLRRRLVVSVSADGGARWREAVVLAPEGAGYSVAAPLPGGALAVLWEDAAYRRLVLTRLGTDELAGTAPTEPAPPAALVATHVVPARPERWVDVGERRVLAAPGDLDRAVYKIVGSGDGGQLVASREAYEANLGPLHRGLAAGDVLVCAARLPGVGGPLHWAGAPVPTEERAGADGPRRVAYELRHVVTEAEIAAGVVSLTCTDASGGVARTTVPVRLPGI